MSGIGEAGLVLSLISSTLAIFDAAHDIYDAVNDISGLPEKIRVTADQIPLVENALGLAGQNIKAKNVKDETLKSVKPILEQCERNASRIREIFEKAIPTKGASRSERLRKAVGIHGKSRQVKKCMEEVFENLQLLAQNQVFQDTETLADIKETIQRLQSIPDEEEQSQFTHLGTGSINANIGGGTQENYNNSGYGIQYAAQNQYFGRHQDDEPRPKTIHELPHFLLSSHFTGRENELEEIEQRLGMSSHDEPARCIISGMQGVGKTQLALKFAILQKDKYPYIFWISAQSVEKLSHDIAKIVDLLRLPGFETLDQPGKLIRARGWLENSNAARSWLLILDNANDETITMLQDTLPRENHKGRLLITTRVAILAEKLSSAAGKTSQLALQPPGTEEAIAMLLNRAGLREEDKDESPSEPDAKRLVRLIGNLPIAIEMAASYVKETGSSLQEALDAYTGHEILDILSWENDLSKHEEKSVMAVFTPALDRILDNRPDATIILRLFGFCDPEGIPIDIFTQGCKTFYQENLEVSLDVQPASKLKIVKELFEAPVRLSKAIQEVQRLSLVAATQKTETAERIIRIHDLVHLLLRFKLMTKEEQKQWLEIAIYIICQAFRTIDDHRSPNNWSRCSLFVSHFGSLEDFAKQYQLENTFRKELLDANITVGEYLKHCGLLMKAETLTKQTVETKIRLFGDRDVSTLNGMSNLANFLLDQGKYDQAEAMHRRALSVREIVQGKEHPHTLNNMCNFAAVLRSQGRHEEAEKLYRQLLSSMKNILGEEHPDVLTHKNNLAGCLSFQYKNEEAEKIYIQVLSVQKKIRGEKHPIVLFATQNLGRILSNQGKFDEAEELNRQTLSSIETVLGKEHPSTLRNMDDLATVLYALGKHDEAEELLRQSVSLEKKVLGEERPYTLLNMRNLARVLQSQGKYDEAEEIYRQILSLRETILGKEHPDTLTSMDDLAAILHILGKYDEAEEIYRRIIILRETILGKEHPDTLRSMTDLVHIFTHQVTYYGEEVRRRTLSSRETTLGKDHPDTLTSMNNLADALNNRGKYEEAEEIYRRTLSLRERTLGREHPETITSMLNLAEALKEQGRSTEAKSLRKERLQLLYQEHPQAEALSQSLREESLQLLYPEHPQAGAPSQSLREEGLRLLLSQYPHAEASGERLRLEAFIHDGQFHLHKVKDSSITEE